MQTILLAIGLLLLAMLGLGLGLAFNRQPLQRSCGGQACLKQCAGCDRPQREENP